MTTGARGRLRVHVNGEWQGTCTYRIFFKRSRSSRSFESMFVEVTCEYLPSR